MFGSDEEQQQQQQQGPGDFFFRQSNFDSFFQHADDGDDFDSHFTFHFGDSYGQRRRKQPRVEIVATMKENEFTDLVHGHFMYSHRPHLVFLFTNYNCRGCEEVAPMFNEVMQQLNSEGLILVRHALF